MPQPKALVTNVLDFAGPPAVAALAGAGFHVLAHDPSFVDGAARRHYATQNANTEPLAEQTAEALIDAVWNNAGKIDALVSNDSFPAIHGPVESADVNDMRTTLEKLVVFPFALMKAAIPRLKAQGTGRVVMITSSRTRLPMPGGAIPDAARAGANALVKSLSLELAPFGVPVNAIAPNFLYSERYFPKAKFIDDPVGRAYIEQTVPAGRLGRPEEMGELVRHLATMEGSFLTGAIIDFTGGWPAAPRRPA